MCLDYPNNQFQILENQLTIIPIHESSFVEGGSTFTEGEGVAGVTGGGLGGVGSVCSICGDAALELVGTVVGGGSMAAAWARDGLFSPDATGVDE
jgi:hypothetical protein